MSLAARRTIARPAALLVGALLLLTSPPAASQGLPARLTDQQFWTLVNDASEPDGFFQSDNLVSNELTMQVVIPELVKGRAPGGVYLGVGPDQNFTYIAALRPRIAFIVDIRRMAVMQHLMYKALFEMAPDRAEFLSLLFARPRPASVGPQSTPMQLFDAFYATPPDSGMYNRTLREVKDRLNRVHGFDLSADDNANIEFVYLSFHLGGLDITYNFGQGFAGRGGRGMPTFGDLMVATDGNGVNRGFLSSEEAYGAVRSLQLSNLIVPVVGDFAGPRALRTVGSFLKARQAVVSAIYTSNVEQYLFREGDKWREYYDNVAALPVDSQSTFVRAVFNVGGGGGRPFGGAGARSVTLLQPVLDLLKAYREGRIVNYYDVVNMSRTVW